MSKKKNKSRRKVRQPARPRQTLTGPQNLRLQQAVQAQSAGNLAFAESAYRTLITENVKIPQVYNNLGLVYNQTGRQEKALKLFKMALSLDPRFVDARMHLATAYEQAGETDKAVHCYQQVLAHHPGNFVARYQMANQLKAQGKLEEAIAHYRKIMQQNPGYTQAHFTYSGVHKYENASDPHIVAMLELYQNGALGVDHKIHLSFALAKAFEDLKDFPQAFHYLKTGNDLRYKKYQYTVDSDEELISNIIETFSAEAMSGLDIRGESSDRPIFIVGMPRS
ncbi:MAG: tetratricopeptide repeat protein, partial [Xanthomonadales bacterium]|nr:tetratricopeptide repeat protein [Xanthomonadales bacterium]